MNRLNAKRIGVLAASLLFGLAVAGPVSFSNVPIINSAGQPVVQIVVGSSAKPSDGVAAANIAAVIGNLAFTSTPVTATVGGASGLSCVVTTATCAVSNQQVWLGEAGVSAPTGTYGFTALIGSVLNRGITLGSASSTKAAQATTYGFSRGYTTTNSPLDSPYTQEGYVPAPNPPGASTTGGGLAFSTFTNTQDNILQIANQQLPALLSNSGSYGESEYLWLTGFPVYDQQTSPAVQNFALLNAGGAYQVTFTKPIHEPYYSTGNSINNAQITLLGQPWTIVSYTNPSVTTATSTVASHGGKIGIASSLVPLTTVYVGKNLTSGAFTVQLADLGTVSSGISPAAINIYYNGEMTNSSSVWPGNTVKYNVTGHNLYVKVNSTFAGLYAYQKWAKMQMYANVYNITDGQTFNQTTNPGWNVHLLWTNTSGSGHYTDLQSIILVNKTPVTLLAGQSFNFIQSPKAYKITMSGDTLGNNFDPLTIQSQYASSVWYSNAPGSTGNGLGNINNVTEPAQELVVQSQIPNAFSYGGTTSSQVTYLLTPYALAETSNAYTAGAPAGVAGGPVNVVVSITGGYPTANYVSSTNPLIVTLSGFTTNSASSAQTTSLTFSSANSATVGVNSIQTTTGNFYNITAIQMNRALPGVIVTVGQVANTVAGMGFYGEVAANTMAQLTMTTTPQIIYTLAGTPFYKLTSGASVTYNQQNGQSPTTFSMSTASPVSQGSNLFGFFTYNVAELNVPSSTTYTDAFTFNIVNSTSGVTATPLFNLNYSKTGTHNNVTYISSNSNNVNARQGFIGEKGSKVASIGATELTLNLAKTIDTLQFVVGPYNTTINTSKKVVGPYSIGQATNLPNVTIANVTSTCTVTGAGSGCTVSGVTGLTATASVTSATTPVRLDTVATPLVVLDSAANSASTLVVVGSKFVNTVAQEIFAQNPSLDSSFGTGSVVAQAFGSNRILIAGYYANQTVQAGNQFIQALLSATT